MQDRNLKNGTFFNFDMLFPRVLIIFLITLEYQNLKKSSTSYILKVLACHMATFKNHWIQENMRGQRGTLKALARICRCH